MSFFKEQLLPEELPYEKFKKYGPANLSDAELLAIMIRTGTKDVDPIEIGRNILNQKGNDLGMLVLCHYSMTELKRIPGIGEVKAIQLLCIAEISKRISHCTAKEKMTFSDPECIADYYMESMRHEEKERFLLVLLNHKNQFISDCVMSLGTVDSTLVSPRELFIHALKENASYVVILHNHPSGNPTPSKEDIKITQKIKEASALVEIPLLDHIIIGDKRYYSFKIHRLL